MKEFENKIYRRLLAPVLACLVLALAGCSQDATEAEAPSSPTGGTYLTIVTRGINTTDDTQYEDYVGKLRVIAFDTDGNAVDGMNFTIDNMSRFTVKGNGDEASIEVTHVFDSGIITSGVYTFYFVANEDGYNTITESQTLSAALDAVTDESDLELIQVATSMTTSDQLKPTASQMLMSTGPYTALIREGENNRIGDDNHIKLIRAFAKAQLALKLPNTTSSAPFNDDVTVTLSASIPNSFYLIPENTTEITGNISLTDRVISGGGTLFDAEGVSPDPFYVSETIYLPERYLANNNEENALTYSITIGENNYSAPIADGTEDPVNYNIIRNNAYTTIGEYNPLKEVVSTFNLLVIPWSGKEITVPPFE